MSIFNTNARHAKKTTGAKTFSLSRVELAANPSERFLMLLSLFLGFLIGALLTLLFMQPETTTGYTSNDQRMMSLIATYRETRALERRILTLLLNEQYDPTRVIRQYDFDADTDGWYFVQEEKP